MTRNEFVRIGITQFKEHELREIVATFCELPGIAPQMPSRRLISSMHSIIAREILSIVARTMQSTANPEVYGAWHASKINAERAGGAANAIIALCTLAASGEPYADLDEAFSVIEEAGYGGYR